MKSIYDDVEQLIEMQKANAVFLKNGIVQPRTYSILNKDIKDISAYIYSI